VVIPTIRLAFTIALLVFSACGPELTEPADTDVTGTWVAAGPAAGLSNLTVRLIQTESGAISGTYEGIGTEGPQFCPPTPPCITAGPLLGSNTVLQVFIELENAWKNTRQIVGGQTLKGAMERTGLLGPIEFVRVPNAQ
jgi:hypothetical protein